MTSFLFDVPDVVSVPVKAEALRYPLNRIFCVGRNYAAHAAEMGNEVDREAPFYFTKSVQNAALSGAIVPYPAGTSDYHHEMELAVALGQPVFKGTKQQARDAVFGYCCALDMTRRDRQQDGKDKRRPWSLGKDVENSAVFAPITKASDFGGIADQRIWLKVNGESRQDAKLSELIHSVPDVIAHLSKYYRLQPGDVIMTGTPAGVAAVQPGDTLEGGIEGLEPVTLTLTSAE